MKKFIIFTLLIALISLAGVAKAEKRVDYYKKSVSTVAEQLRQQYAIPGMAIAVIDHSRTYTYLFGQADRANGSAVTGDTIFEVGSLTKLFIALLCAEAAEGGSINLDESVSKYAPYALQLAKNPSFAQMSLTNTLTHTAGFPLNLDAAMKSDYPLDHYLLTWQPERPIGSQWQYSNVGFGLAAMILEGQNHQSIDELIKTDILAPLKMKPIGIDIPEKYMNDFAQGYSSDGNAAVRFSHGEGLYPGAWGLKATIDDMAKFMSAAIGFAKTPKRIMKAMQNTQTPRVGIGSMQQGLAWQGHSLEDNSLKHEPQNMNIGPLPAQWLPKEEQIYRADLLLDKTGSTPGFRSYIAIIPGKQVGVVILANKNIPNGAIVNAGRAIIGIGKLTE
jgi:beta-lactamase class C